MKIAYIVAAYFGARRVEAAAYRVEKLSYIKKHLKNLSTLNHNVSKIFFVINEEAKYASETTKAKYIIDNYEDIECEIIVRENLGMSYAAWNDVLQKHGHDYDYSFLIEDDYVPIVDNFDKKFIQYFDENESLGYVCQLWWDNNGYHAGIANGVVNMKRYFDAGGFEVFQHAGYDGGQHNQQTFLNYLTGKGYHVRDTGDRYRNLFLNHNSQIISYGNKDGQDLIVPIHESVKCV